MSTQAHRPSSTPTIARTGGVVDSVRKLDPRRMARNPVMFVVEVGSVLRHDPVLQGPRRRDRKANVFAGCIAAWLWFTVLFANFAEAMAEGRGKAQADSAAQDARRDDGPTAAGRRDGRGGRRARRSPSATSWSSPPARSSLPTATSSRASRAWTSRRSPASRRRSSASRAATARPSPAAPACCRTGSSSEITTAPARASSTG